MKTLVRRTALTSIAILFLLGGTTAAFADSPQSQHQSQTLNMTIPTGGVTDLGNQVYAVSGGQVAYAMIAGQTLNPGATIQYRFVANQTGMTTTGSASIRLTGTTTSGASVRVSGEFNITGILAAAVIGQSELPFFFLTDTSNVQMTIAGSPQTLPESLSIESPYFNPFGAPIVMASPDGAIIIAATYTRGSIVWNGSQVTGPLVGTLGTTPVTGTMTLTGGERENLVKGTATDAGTTTFSGMTPTSLNANGSYRGSDTIPTTGTSDCSAVTGIPGTCTETGFQSSGRFRAGDISGNYTTTWGVPAIGFTSSITATVSQNGDSGSSGHR